MTKFIEEFDSVEDIISSYRAPPDALEGAEVLVAWYGYGSYEGYSFVLFRKDGKLYEVNGSHCSCYALEDQWEPEETSKEVLEKRKFYHSFDGYKEAQAALGEVLEQL